MEEELILSFITNPHQNSAGHGNLNTKGSAPGTALHLLLLFSWFYYLVPIYFYFWCWFYKPSNGEFLLIPIWVPINPIKGKLGSLVKINLSGQSLGWCWINPILWAAGQGHGHGAGAKFLFLLQLENNWTHPCTCTERHFWKQGTEKLQDSWKNPFFFSYLVPLLIMQKPSSIPNPESADSIHTPAFEWENEI